MSRIQQMIHSWLPMIHMRYKKIIMNCSFLLKFKFASYTTTNFRIVGVMWKA